MTNITVSSGAFLKAYGRFSEAALREPVSITNHGRERLVLLSADEYRRLKRNDRVSLYAWELSDEDLKALAVSESPTEAEAYDHEMK